MNGFKDYLYGWLVENAYISEDGDTTVEDLTAEYVYGETDVTPDILEDAWFDYSHDCDSVGAKPVNDLDGFDEPY